MVVSEYDPGLSDSKQLFLLHPHASFVLAPNGVHKSDLPDLMSKTLRFQLF